MVDEKIIELFFARSEQAISELDVKYGKIFNKGIKNSSLCVVDGAGHFCFLEKPLKVRKLIKDFYSGENL